MNDVLITLINEDILVIVLGLSSWASTMANLKGKRNCRVIHQLSLLGDWFTLRTYKEGNVIAALLRLMFCTSMTIKMISFLGPGMGGS